MRKVFLSFALVCLSACGGSPSSPSQQPFTQHIAATVDVFGTTEHSLSIPRSGTMTIMLRWSNATDLDLYLTNSGCQVTTPEACTIFASATGTTGTQESITRTVTTGETYKLFVDNNSVSLSSNYTLDVTIQ